MTRQRRKELIQAMGLFVVFGGIWHALGVENLLHELSHAIVISARGGTVHEFTIGWIRASGYDGIGLYAGTLGGVLIRSAIALWLLGSRRSLIIPAWMFGRIIMEWMGWWIGTKLDIGLMSSSDAAFYSLLHGSMTLGIVVGAIVIAVRLVRRWDRQAPKQMENPALFRRHAESRW